MRSFEIAILLAVVTWTGVSRSEEIVAYQITNASEIRESLTGAVGSAEAGSDLYATEPRAGCPACHGMPGAEGINGDDDPKLEAAPDLAGIGTRLNSGELRLWLVAPKVLNPETTMPPYYAAGQRKGADDPLYGGPALTAAEIEDLVAYLSSLTAR